VYEGVKETYVPVKEVRGGKCKGGAPTRSPLLHPALWPAHLHMCEGAGSAFSNSLMPA
jgi:hypothetical protein